MKTERIKEFELKLKMHKYTSSQKHTYICHVYIIYGVQMFHFWTKKNNKKRKMHEIQIKIKCIMENKRDVSKCSYYVSYHLYSNLTQVD